MLSLSLFLCYWMVLWNQRYWYSLCCREINKNFNHKIK